MPPNRPPSRKVRRTHGNGRMGNSLGSSARWVRSRTRLRPRSGAVARRESRTGYHCGTPTARRVAERVTGVCPGRHAPPRAQGQAILRLPTAIAAPDRLWHTAVMASSAAVTARIAACLATWMHVRGDGSPAVAAWGRTAQAFSGMGVFLGCLSGAGGGEPWPRRTGAARGRAERDGQCRRGRRARPSARRPDGAGGPPAARTLRPAASRARLSRPGGTPFVRGQ